jgi:hypothetical protein
MSRNEEESMSDTALASLYERRDALWRDFFLRSRFARCILEEQFDRRLLAIYFIETFHYVQHNPRHQALVSARDLPMPVNYRKFCLLHAEEETGHELMALNDLKSLHVCEPSVVLPPPLHSTELFNAYLYAVSTRGNPLRRLGYSFWAEDSYQYIQTLLARTMRVLDLTHAHLTFLISHSNIDKEHSKAVVETISLYCRSAEDWQAVGDVMEGSLRLQFAMLEEIHEAYRALCRGESNRFSFLTAAA